MDRRRRRRRAARRLCASYAAGVVRVRRRARASSTSRSSAACSPRRRRRPTSSTGHGTLRGAAWRVGSDPRRSSLAVHERMTAAEVAIAEARPRRDRGRRRPARARRPAARPPAPRRRGRHDQDATTSRTCRPSSNRVVGALRAGRAHAGVHDRHDRSAGTRGTCACPGGEDAPWAGIVRCEASADLAPADAIALADRDRRGAARGSRPSRTRSRARRRTCIRSGVSSGSCGAGSATRQLLYRALRAAAPVLPIRLIRPAAPAANDPGAGCLTRRTGSWCAGGAREPGGRA